MKGLSIVKCTEDIEMDYWVDHIWHLIHPTEEQTVFCQIEYYWYEDGTEIKPLKNLKEITCPKCKKLIKIIRSPVK